MDAARRVEPPAEGDDWLDLSAGELPVADVLVWVRRPDCGGVVVFCGVARDHSEGRPGVHRLVYEAYEEHVVKCLCEVAAQARDRWGTIGRIAMVHRTGELAVGEDAVVVAVSAPHREAAFAAARFCIDTLKATVPIWKKESWRDGQSWGLEAQHLPSGVRR